MNSGGTITIEDTNPDDASHNSAINFYNSAGLITKIWYTHKISDDIDLAAYSTNNVMVSNHNNSTLTGGAGNDTFVSGTSGVIALGTGNNALYLDEIAVGDTGLIQFDDANTQSDSARSNNTFYGYNPMTDFLVTDAESLSKQSVVFSDGAVKIKSGKTINTFFIDGTAENLDNSASLDDILDISLDDIINKSDGEVDFALDDAQSLPAIERSTCRRQFSIRV